MAVSRNVSYVNSVVNSPLIGLTTHQLLEKRVQEHPDREMYVFPEDNERITFKAFKDRVEVLAAGLLSLGMMKGHRLAIWCNVHMEFVLFVAAARSIGVIVVRIRSTFPNIDVENILLRAGCRVILLGRSPIDLYDRLKNMEIGQLQGETRKLHAIIGVGENNKSGTYSVDDLLKLGADPEFTELFNVRKTEVTFDDDSDILTTSGYTGQPKYVMHTHVSIINGLNPIYLYLEDIPTRGNRRILACNSAHVGGEDSGVIPPLITGMTSVFAPSTYDIKQTLQSIQDERCTDAAFYITHLYDMVNFKDIDKYDLSSLEVCTANGSSIPCKLLKEFERTFSCKVLITYGSTEVLTPAMSSWLDPVDIRCSEFRILPNYEVQVVDNEWRCVPVGSVGEIWCRGCGCFQRYYGNEEKTREDKTANGWVKTGDLGMLNSRGNLTIVGRKKNMIIRGAINIFPRDIETVLSQHTCVDQVQVIGVPDERLGQDICICIRTKANTSIDKEEIVVYLAGKVTNDECNPAYVLVFDAFPKSDVGKIDQTRLKQQALRRIQNEMTE